MKTASARPLKTPLVVLAPGAIGEISVDMEVIKKASLSLRALTNPLRKKILELIESRGEIIVSELYAALKIEQSVASIHLAILRRAEIVNARRDGRNIYYSINGKRIGEIAKLASKLTADSTLDVPAHARKEKPKKKVGDYAGFPVF